MALVLYQGGGAGSTGGSTNTTGTSSYSTPGVGVSANREDQDIQKVADTLDQLQSDKRKKLYIGLANQGATCYMNSLLQSLYMTAEFRQFIYTWVYND